MEVTREIAEQQPGPPPDRVTVVAHLYHYSNLEGLHEFPVRFTSHLRTAEQVYPRHLRVTPEWTPLDTGWLEKCSFLCIENAMQGRHNPIHGDVPDKKHVIELSYSKRSDEAFLVYPKEGYYLRPSQAKKLFIRSQAGTIPVLIQILPE